MGPITILDVPHGTSRHSLVFPEIDTACYERRVLNNVAMYQIDFVSADSEELVTSLKMVAAIDIRDGVMFRRIFSPFE